MRGHAEVRDLMRRALGFVTAPESTVQYEEEHALATRFADNAITQNVSGESSLLTLTVAWGNRHGYGSTNRLDEGALRRLAGRVESMASGSPEDPEYMPPIGPVEYPEIPASFAEATARAHPEQLAEAIRACAEVARANRMVAAGTFEANWRARAVADSLGLFAYQKSSGAEFGITLRTPSGTGKASIYTEDLDRILPRALAQQAIHVAERNRDQVALEPGEYVVILSPYAVAELLAFLFANLDAREAGEGVTPFAGRVGQRLFDERIKIISPIDDPDIPPPLFGESGLPVRGTVWVDKGVLKRLRHTRFWAKERGTNPNAQLFPVRMEGEDRGFEELVSTCDRGLLVHRLWYIRYVDRKELLLTGMTRDGLFLVEDGKVTRAVKNFRFNESPLAVLRNVIAMSRAERASAHAKVPGIMARNFTMSSTTAF